VKPGREVTIPWLSAILYETGYAGQRINPNTGRVDKSAVDFKVAKWLLDAEGFSPAETLWICLNSLIGVRPEHRNPKDYWTRTIGAALERIKARKERLK
jgi:hypothetical protein